MREGDYELEFYVEAGWMPVKEWLTKLEEDEPAKYDAIVYGLQEILAKQGTNVCNTDFGENLGGGLYEFRLRQDHAQLVSRVQPHLKGTVPDGPEVDILVRVFFGVYGDKIILLLHGYDKGKDTNAKRQRKEIKVARKRLSSHPRPKGVKPHFGLRALDWFRRNQDQ